MTVTDQTRGSAVHVLIIENRASTTLDACSSCFAGSGTDGLRVEVVSVAQLDGALAHLEPSSRRVCVLALDAGTDDAELLRQVNARHPDLPLLVASATAGADDIWRCLNAGAADYVTPPFTAASVLPRALRLASAASPSEPVPEIEGFVGRSSIFRALLEKIRAVARCDGTVLIQGETGTGKELCAHAIHQLSSRRQRPFCAINCGAIPKDLVENELFGHQKAAFTGASATHAGLIAASDGGTLLFDEVDAFGPGEQARLLRFVENQEYRPLGSTRVLKADVRVLAATNANLAEKVRQGEFREDLYYRLDMLRVRVAPLREHREDIPLLAMHALTTFARKFRARSRAFTEMAMEALISHDWPGNVRELEHVIGRAVAFAFHAEIIDREHLEIDGVDDPRKDVISASLRESKRRVIEEFERSRLCAYLVAHGGNIGHAALAAGKNRRAFWELMRKYSIRAEDFQHIATRRHP
jgi:two-component system, NtrC family, response regulator GlrR